MAKIFYIDDALNSEEPTLEKKTLNFLKDQLAPSVVTGFGTYREIFHYFFDYNNLLADLFIFDHNLNWRKDISSPYGYKFRYSDQLIMYLKSIRGELLLLPKIIYSDDDKAPVRYRNSEIPYNIFVPKWGDSPWVNLVREAKNILERPNPKERKY